MHGIIEYLNHYRSRVSLIRRGVVHSESFASQRFLLAQLAHRVERTTGDTATPQGGPRRRIRRRWNASGSPGICIGLKPVVEKIFRLVIALRAWTSPPVRIPARRPFLLRSAV